MVVSLSARRLISIVCLLSLLLLSSCAAKGDGPSSTGSADLRDTTLQLLSHSLPPLPDDREASTVRAFTRYGRYTYVRTENAAEIGNALELVSTADELSWGIWRFNPWIESLQSIHVVMTVPDGDQAWIALSDYSRDSWKFDGPLTAGKSLPLDDAKLRSDSGDFYLAVVTSGGNQATVHMLVLTTEDGWVIVTVDDYGDVGGHTSLALVDGKPAISYYSFFQDDLKYASSATATGSNAADWSVITVDGAGDVGNYSSLAEVEGQPAISYRDWDERALKYVRRLPFEPYSWTPVTVDTSDLGEDVGEYTSLAVVEGRPLITYHDAGEGRLLHAQSLTATGMLEADWVDYVTDNGDDAVGMDNSLAVVDGKAAVAYAWDYTVSFLRYKWFPNAAKVSVAMTSGQARSTSLAEVYNAPAISWYDDGDGFLYYSFSSTPRGTDSLDWTSVPVDFIGESPKYTSLAVIDGRPAICYTKATSGASNCLALAWSSTPVGWEAADWQSTIADETSQHTGYFPSLAEVDGKPAISYHDATNQSLKYAIRLGP